MGKQEDSNGLGVREVLQVEIKEPSDFYDQRRKAREKDSQPSMLEALGFLSLESGLLVSSTVGRLVQAMNKFGKGFNEVLTDEITGALTTEGFKQFPSAKVLALETDGAPSLVALPSRGANYRKDVPKTRREATEMMAGMSGWSLLTQQELTSVAAFLSPARPKEFLARDGQETNGLLVFKYSPFKPAHPELTWKWDCDDNPPLSKKD